MLKAIGLNAQELRRIDPAEALQRVAVALNRYSDDGNKARIVQELFGKSVREAPFMKDLAENRPAQRHRHDQSRRGGGEVQQATVRAAEELEGRLAPY